MPTQFGMTARWRARRSVMGPSLPRLRARRRGVSATRRLLGGFASRARAGCEGQPRTFYAQRPGWLITAVGARGEDWGRLFLVCDAPRAHLARPTFYQGKPPTGPRRTDGSSHAGHGQHLEHLDVVARHVQVRMAVENGGDILGRAGLQDGIPRDLLRARVGAGSRVRGVRRRGAQVDD